jgi:hypothetical protein
MARLVSKVGSREALLRARVFRAARIASEPGSVRYLGARPEGPGAECLVRSEADPRWFYHVILRPPHDPEGDACACPDFARRGGPDLPCKHILAVRVREGSVYCVRCLRSAAPRTGEILCDDCRVVEELEAARGDNPRDNLDAWFFGEPGL